jgi:hypothetical protein
MDDARVHARLHARVRVLMLPLALAFALVHLRAFTCARMHRRLQARIGHANAHAPLRACNVNVISTRAISQEVDAHSLAPRRKCAHAFAIAGAWNARNPTSARGCMNATPMRACTRVRVCACAMARSSARAIAWTCAWLHAHASAVVRYGPTHTSGVYGPSCMFHVVRTAIHGVMQM